MTAGYGLKHGLNVRYKASKLPQVAESDFPEERGGEILSEFRKNLYNPLDLTNLTG